jgi:hypothetical protein
MVPISINYNSHASTLSPLNLPIFLYSSPFPLPLLFSLVISRYFILPLGSESKGFLFCVSVFAFCHYTIPHIPFIMLHTGQNLGLLLTGSSQLEAQRRDKTARPWRDPAPTLPANKSTTSSPACQLLFDPLCDEV